MLNELIPIHLTKQSFYFNTACGTYIVKKTLDCLKAVVDICSDQHTKTTFTHVLLPYGRSIIQNIYLLLVRS
jgi:hypothetical protein